MCLLNIPKLAFKARSDVGIGILSLCVFDLLKSVVKFVIRFLN